MGNELELESDAGTCPTPALLAAFLCDELPPPAMDEIGAHVSSCRDCDFAVRRMDDATDATLKAFRKHLCSSEADTPPDDLEYRRMMAEARALSPTLLTPPVPVQNLPPPSQLGQYRIGERLGRGGMGAVYRAEHVRLKKWVAVKVLYRDQVRDPRAVARFQLEMEVVGRLDHPNIVRATDAGDADGVHFLVMELIDGLNLAHLLLKCGPLPVPEACELVRQAAIGLQHAHEHGLVHRDVKPSNLMLSASGHVKVLDLGLALLRANGPVAVGELTGVGEVMGTADYMAPEQWAESHTVDIRADVYSLGCTLYALLTGDPPFSGSARRSFMRMMVAHQEEPVQPVTKYRKDIPPALIELLGRMLAKTPADRPATPGEVVAELERLANGADLPGLSASALRGAPIANRSDPISPSPTSRIITPPPAPAPTPRRRWPVAALVFAILAMGSVYALLATGPAKPNEEPHDPKKWRNLLAKKPGERLWAPTNLSQLLHQPDKELLAINSAMPALIRLGDAPAPGYKLQIGFQQIEWTGKVGVYFGGRVEADKNRFLFHLVQLKHIKAGKGREFGLERSGAYMSLEPGAKPDVSSTGFATTFFGPPDDEEQMLELEVKPNGLAVVRWNGLACDALVDAKAITKASKYFPDTRLDGEFGFYCDGTSVTVSTARFVLTE